MTLEGNPAILLGNGINIYAANKLSSVTKNKSWKELLIELSGITYPEIFELIRASKKDEDFTGVKNTLVSYIQEFQGTEIHKNFVKFTSKENIPVLTTNYDTCLLSEELMQNIRGVNKAKGQRKRKKFAPITQNGLGFSDIYPWFSYYSDRNIAKCIGYLWNLAYTWFVVL